MVKVNNETTMTAIPTHPPLTPDASINRFVLRDIPGVKIDEEVRGRTAFELVGTPTVFEMIRANAAALRIPPAAVAEQNTDAFIRLDAAFDSGNEKVRRTARDIARRFGRNLGYVLLALRHPDAVREHPAPWEPWMNEHWLKLPRLWLGGGLIRGHLGKWAIPYIRGVFTEAGITPPDLMRDPYGASLPLIGAACCVPKTAVSAAVLDFGRTGVKRGAASYSKGALHGMHLLPTTPTRWDEAEDANNPDDLRRFQYEFMIPAIADTFTEARPESRLIPISIAAYVDSRGEPYARQANPYAGLRGFEGTLQETLAREVSRRVGRDVKVMLIHDGTAAATAHPGDTVMALGTAIGIGYWPAVPEPRGVEDGLVIK
jgi:hypothetical protein